MQMCKVYAWQCSTQTVKGIITVSFRREVVSNPHSGGVLRLGKPPIKSGQPNPNSSADMVTKSRSSEQNTGQMGWIKKPKQDIATLAFMS